MYPAVDKQHFDTVTGQSDKTGRSTVIFDNIQVYGGKIFCRLGTSDFFNHIFSQKIMSSPDRTLPYFHKHIITLIIIFRNPLHT